MSLPQQKFREIVFQLLFSRDVGEVPDQGLVGLIMKELAVTRKSVLQALERVQMIEEFLPEIDAKIAEASSSYDFSRIQRVERNILRIGCYELLHDDAIPPAVAISEAMRLARKFGTVEAASYVNALLDHLHRGGDRSEELTRSAQELEMSEQAALQAAQEELDSEEE